MKSNFAKVICTLTSAAMVSCAMPLEAVVSHALDAEQSGAQTSVSELNLEEFAQKSSQMTAAYEDENSFFGEIEIKTGESGVYIDGEKQDIDGLETARMNGDVLMADAGVFEVLDSSSEVVTNDGEITLSTDNGEIELSDQSAIAVTENGETILSQKVETEEDTAMLPIAEVAQTLGYEAYQKEDSVVLRNPFESARLIVKSSDDIDILNAVDVISGFMDLHILQFENSSDAYSAYCIYSESDNVEFVTPSQLKSVQATSETETEHNSWGASVMGVDSFNSMLSESALDQNEVIVAVVDTGIDTDHEMFEGRLVEAGVNFSASDVAGAEDDHGHGTHVSGIICDLTLDNVKILPVKSLGANGQGYDEAIFAGILYAVENGADVINMSFGGFGTGELYDELISIAAEKGVILCAAAGNESIDCYRCAPASNDNVITVSALDSDMEFAYYSNFGNEVEFAAPGSAVYSAHLNGKYKTLTGTSMASPHVAAAVAMLKSYNSDLNTEQVVDILASSAIDLGETGYDEYYGYGAVCFDNIEICTEKCQNVEFSVNSGEYDSAFTLELSALDENAQIYYTINQSEFDIKTAQLYTAGIEITNSCVISAAVLCDGKYMSDVVSATYIIANGDVADCFVVENGVLTSYNGILSEVVVPESINGEEITAIGDSAFENNETITSVILPQSVTEIGENAFANCKNLEQITANGVKALGTCAFYGCKSLESIFFESALSVSECCFDSCSTLKTVTLPNATELLLSAFMGCESLETIDAPKVTFVDDIVFYGCTNLSDASLDYENMTNLGIGAFYLCPAFKTPIVCEKLTTLGDFCFYGCKQLECVVLPDSMQTIASSCFEGCESLYYLGAKGVTSLMDSAMSGCGEVYVSMDIDALEISDLAFYNTTLKEFAIDITQTLNADIDTLEVVQNGTALEISITQSGTYYINILGAVLPEITVTDTNGTLCECEYIGLQDSKAVYSAQLGIGTYTIKVLSKSADGFAVQLSASDTDSRTDISQADIVCNTKLSTQTNAEDIDLSVELYGETLVSGVDYTVGFDGLSVTVFGTGDYCGYCRIYPAITKSVELYTTYQIDSDFGDNEFAFTPEVSGTYYYYALYSEEQFLQRKDTNLGSDLNVGGKILNAKGDIIGFNDVCLLADCYSYSYFYIEAYLEAGQTYYLQSCTYGDMGEYCIRVTDDLVQMFDTNITVTSSVASTGEEVFADVTVKYNGKQLANGEDYLTVTVDNVLPGYAYVYIMGINDYFGICSRRFTVTADDCEKQEISVGETVEFDLAQGEFAAVTVNIDTAATHRITYDSDSTVYSYIRHTSTALSYQYEKNTIEMSMKTGEYIIMFYAADNSATTISITIETLYSISGASVYNSSLSYQPGVVQTPQLTLYYGIKKLTENVDYSVKFIASSHLPGVYYYKITGMGVYTGTATGTYTVDCEISSRTATSISTGEHTVSITSGGSYSVFKFTAPQDATYLLSTRELANVALIVYDESKNIVTSSCAPMGFGTEFTMQANDVMYIVAMYYDSTKTGSWQFEMTDDYTLMEDVDAAYDEQVHYYGEKALPDVTFTDGDYTLVEGVDYEYYYASGCNSYGEATVCYKGLGRYKFYRYIEYTLIAPLSTLVENPTELIQDNAVHYDGDYGECGIYAFKAPKDGNYYLSVLSIIDAIEVQFYDENGFFVHSTLSGGGIDVQYPTFLKENETVYMVTYYTNCMNYDYYSGYIVRATYRSDVKTETYTENGITYTIFPSLGYAVVSGVDPSVTNAKILSEVNGVAVTQINADVFRDNTAIQTVTIPSSVTEIGANCFANSSVEKVFVSENAEIIGYNAFAGTNITKLCVFSLSAQFILNSVSSPSVVYGYADSTAQNYCSENNVEFVLIGGLYGDANGDGKVNVIDATCVARYSVKAVDIDADLLAYCDVTGDGKINIVDATCIARYAVHNIDKFPCEE